MKHSFILFLIILFTGSISANEKLIFVADEWCPAICGDEKNPGYMIELVREALKIEGNYQVSSEVMGWSRSIQMADEGKITGVVAGSKVDFEGLKISTIPLGYAGGCFYTRAGEDNWTYAGVKSFEGKVVGWVQDYAWTEEFDQWIEKNKKDPKKVFVITGDDPYSRLKSLLNLKRIDTFGEDDNVWAYITRDDKIKYGNAGCEPYDPQVDDLYAGFSANEKLAPKIDKIIKQLDMGLKKVLNTDIEKSIMKKYGISTLEQRHKEMLERKVQGWKPKSK